MAEVAYTLPPHVEAEPCRYAGVDMFVLPKANGAARPVRGGKRRRWQRGLTMAGGGDELGVPGADLGRVVSSPRAGLR